MWCYTHDKVKRVSDWQKLQDIIGVSFNDISLLQQAFVHTSYINENPDFTLQDNERLEFLGDACLNMVVAEDLFKKFPDAAEGDLTRMRVSLIRQETSARVAAMLNLGDFLYLGKGEDARGVRKQQSTLDDTYEALLGAIFLDQGFDVTKAFIMNTIGRQFDLLIKSGAFQNHKAMLQEFTQAEYKQLPVYELVTSDGPDHDKLFTITVALGDKVLGTGTGKTKRAAEMEAARSALEKLRRDSNVRISER
ncbi:MAG TPA: ribonuclease III [Dehalococcoidia bacterium]|nr:ribonuclease III [Dehalococcoidia bacterium]